MPSRVLVIGGSGYIGQQLAAFLKKYHFVTWTYYTNPHPASPDSCHLDIRQYSAVAELIGSLQPHCIFHLAYSPNDPAHYVLEGAQNTLRARADLCPNSRFIYLSTDAVFDGETPPYTEASAPRPICAYGRAKRTAELSVLDSGGHVVRTSIVYGFDPPDFRTAALRDAAATGKFPHAYFSDEIRSPVFVQDLCLGLIELMQFPESDDRILHIAGPEPLSRYQAAVKIAESFGVEAPVPVGRLSQSGLIRPRDVTLDTRLARFKLSTKLRSMDEVIRDRAAA